MKSLAIIISALLLSCYNTKKTNMIMINPEIKTVKETAKQLTLKHIVRVPDAIIEKTKLIIMLHGVGSNEVNMMDVGKDLLSENIIVSAQAPIVYNNRSFAWYDVDFSTGKPVYNVEQVYNSRKLLFDFVKELQEKYNIEEKNTYLFGFSQGAIMAYDMLLQKPNSIAGIIAIGGRILKESVVNSIITASTNVLIVHGNNDNVLPFHYAEEAYGYFIDHGISPKVFMHYQGHSVPQESFVAINSFLN